MTGAGLMSVAAIDPDPDETKPIRDLIDEVIPQSDIWLDTLNDLFGGKKPSDFIGTADELRLRELARALKHGMLS